MNASMSIYMRLNPTLLVQAEVGLGLVHFANMFNISLTICKLLLYNSLIKYTILQEKNKIKV